MDPYWCKKQIQIINTSIYNYVYIFIHSMTQWYVDSSSILQRVFAAGLGANWKSNPEHSECVSLASLIEISCVQSAWQNRRAMQECYTQKPNGSPVTTQKDVTHPTAVRIVILWKVLWMNIAMDWILAFSFAICVVSQCSFSKKEKG